MAVIEITVRGDAIGVVIQHGQRPISCVTVSDEIDFASPTKPLYRGGLASSRSGTQVVT
jgi:hypothetical protein